MTDSSRLQPAVQVPWADQLLNSFEALGATAERYGFGNIPKNSASAEAFSQGTDLVTHSSSALSGVDEGLNAWSPLQEWARGDFPSPVATAPYAGAIAKGLQTVGNVVDAATGVLGLAAAFKHDRDVGDHSYSGTLKQAVRSTAQISVSSLAGGAAFAVASGSAIVAGTVGLPLVLGVGAAIATGYVAGKALEWVGL